MEILIAIAFVIGGLALLAGGGEALVRGATTVAEFAGVTPAVIGLTVVAMGTSLPELMVSLLAAAQGQPDLAVANVVGSNIFNIAVTLGITAVILPLPVHGSAVRLEWPVMLGVSFLCLLLSRDGTIDRLEAGFFVVSLVLFIAYTVHVARGTAGTSEAAQLADQVEARDIDASERPRLFMTIGALIVGIIALVIGGQLLVAGAVDLARIAGMTERVIGLTIVAGGTGAPELATSLIAALRKRTDVAIANIIGSNIFNILGILGFSALVAPISVSRALVMNDMWWMIATVALLFPLMRTASQLSRAEGVLLIGVFGVYLTLLLRS
jgi:cation:H+ antiporter